MDTFEMMHRKQPRNSFNYTRGSRNIAWSEPENRNSRRIMLSVSKLPSYLASWKSLLFVFSGTCDSTERPKLKNQGKYTLLTIWRSGQKEEKSCQICNCVFESFQRYPERKRTGWFYDFIRIWLPFLLDLNCSSWLAGPFLVFPKYSMLSKIE